MVKRPNLGRGSFLSGPFLVPKRTMELLLLLGSDGSSSGGSGWVDDLNKETDRTTADGGRGAVVEVTAEAASDY